MKSRGQDSFVHMPGFAAGLYGSLTRTKAIQRQHREIARDLVSRIEGGRLLDIGTGPGKLLFEVHQLAPQVELFGLDISAAMVGLAGKNLSGIRADLRQGDIRKTDYEENFFDLVTCTGSFYLWDEPEKGLDEIFRILKRGRSAYLFETHRDFNEPEVQAALKANLKEENLLRKLVTPVFLMKQLRMTYSTSEIEQIVNRTRFSESFAVGKITLAGLPAWLRIKLTKVS